MVCNNADKSVEDLVQPGTKHVKIKTHLTLVPAINVAELYAYLEGHLLGSYKSFVTCLNLGLMMASNSRSFLGRQWQRLGLSPRLIVSMMRNALPPTAALWIIQSTTLGQGFDIVGYLPIIITIIEQPIPPRVQFIRGLFVTCLLNCIVACISLLAGYCGSQARLHTTPPGGDLSAYNGSAAAVAGIWLIFTVWAIQTFRVYYPQYTPSAILSTILAEVSITIGAQLTTTADHVAFITQMLQMFFLAHSFATAVNLLVFPTSSRDEALSDIKSYLSLVEDVLSAESSYVQSLERSPLLFLDSEGNLDNRDEDEPQMPNSNRPHNAENLALRGAVASMSRLHSKLRADVSLAKKDFGWSTISADDFDFIVENFRKLIVSLRGMSALMPIFQRLCEGRGWGTFEDSVQNTSTSTDSEVKLETEKEDRSQDEKDRLQWKAIFSDLQGPVDEVTVLILNGLQHVSISLGLEDPSILDSLSLKEKKRKANDLESKGENAPGSSGFTRSYEERLNMFHERKGTTLRKWVDRGKINEIPEETATTKQTQRLFPLQGNRLGSYQEQMFVILFMQNLFHHIMDVVLDLARFADSKNPAISGKRKQLIVPTSRRLWKLLQQLGKEDESHENFDNGVQQSSATGNDLRRVVSTATTKRNLERPRGLTSHLVGFVSKISGILGSSQSFFGFRVACAVMSVVIVGLLSPTQTWFFNQRALWAAVFIPFSMAPNSGETFSILLFRLIGSAAALGIALVNWYIVDGHPAGIIIFYFIFKTFANYFIIKFPQYGTVWRPTLITHAIIVGYSLQERISHTPQPPATVNHSYPPYLIGPYRYACTAVGVLAAFFWTVFPLAVSSRSIARKKLGQALSLLASYYNCMHSTVGMWASSTLNDTSTLSSPAKRLNKIRNKLFSRELVTLNSIRQYIHFSRFEPSMGIDFPAKLYHKITTEVDTAVSYMNLVIYATTFLNTSAVEGSNSSPAWRDHLAQAYKSADFSSHGIAALLSVLSMSVTNNQPLPPGLATPKPYHLARHIQKTDPEILSVAHAEDPGFSEFAVVEIGASLLYGSLGRLLIYVNELAGVEDFLGDEKEALGKRE